jgi:hypothetical protein
MRVLFLIAAAIFLALPAKAQQPEPTPAPAQGPLSQVVGKYLGKQSVGQSLKKLQDTVQSLVKTFPTYSARMREVLVREARGIAQVLLGSVIVAEVVFVGCRIVMGAPIVDQLTRLVVTSFIYIVVSQEVTVKAFPAFRDALAEGGRLTGAEIIRFAHPSVLAMPGMSEVTANEPAAMEPCYYWAAWIGTPPTAEEASSPAWRGTYKFSVGQIMDRIWSEPALSTYSEGSSFADNVLDALVNFGLGAFLFLFPVQAISMMTMIAGIQTGALLMPAFGFVGLMISAIVAFDIAIALGLATLPLMYFESFRRLWAQYLVVLMALTLVPCFYYLFSAIGFVTSTTMFEILFPEGGENSLAPLISSVYLTCMMQLTTVFEMMAPGLMNIAGADKIVGMMLDIVMFFGRMMFGSLLLLTFISLGVSFASIAPMAAFRWNQGFGSDAIFETINRSLLGLQSTLGSGIGSVMSDTINRGASFLGGAMRGAAGFMRGP